MFSAMEQLNNTGSWLTMLICKHVDDENEAAREISF
jgi:hypothetical protein